ncbi:MAG: lysine biosynthesis protein LysX [Candidatus Bathyarchaeia archaeon]
MNRLVSEIGMVCDRVRPDERLLIDAAKRKGVGLHIYDAENTFFDITNPLESYFEPAILQRSISYFRGLHVTALLESKGVKVINSYKAASICGNKALTSIALAKARVPTPKSLLAFTEEAALRALDTLGYPAILKPVVGSWGRLIAPLKDVDSAKAIFESREYMFPLYQIYYLQEMIERPKRDIRCFVIGDQAVAAIYRYSAPGDWKTNIARGGKAEPCPITPQIEELAIRAAKAVGGGAFGVDIMESENGLLVHEVNATTEFKTTTEVTGIDIPGRMIDYLLEIAKK